MDLRNYQRQMFIAIEKYLNKSRETNCLELLKEIIIINEKQKFVINAMRQRDKLRGMSPASNSSIREVSNNDEFSDNHSAGSLPDDKISSHFECKSQTDSIVSAEEDYSLNLISFQPEEESRYGQDDRIHSPSVSFMSFHGKEDESKRNAEIHSDILFNVITANEYMNNLGLLTLNECEEVMRNRIERQRKNAFSHLFCNSIWEKHETKRKKRDWLLSTSPPQLRRKIRPNSQPSSQQPSRSTSPLDPGPSSPTTSFTHSPLSPEDFSNGNTRILDQTCHTCSQKNVSVQCEGCGFYYHGKCVMTTKGVNSIDFSCEWLCNTCEKKGLRSMDYRDPLHYNLNCESDASSSGRIACRTTLKTETSNRKKEGIILQLK